MRADPRIIALLLYLPLSGCAPPPPAEKADTKSNIEFRLAESEPAEGLVETRAPGWNKPIYLHKEVEMTGAEIREAAPGLTEDGEPEVIIRFTKVGAQKISHLADVHAGKILAILVDGEVVLAPPIRGQITEHAAFTGGLTRADAARIAKRLGGK
jgi:preprotein translocase subunit SecD